MKSKIMKPALKRKASSTGNPAAQYKKPRRADKVYKGPATEKKAYDVIVKPTVDTTGYIFQTFLPAAGTDINQRVGRKCIVKSIFLRGYIYSNPALIPSTANASCAAQQVRVIVFWDTQPNGANPVITDLLYLSGPESQLNINNRDRFTILSDWTAEFGPIVAGTNPIFNGNQIMPYKKYIRVNKETIFGTTGGTIAAINSGALMVALVGSNASGLDAAEMNIQTRVRYTDA